MTNLIKKKKKKKKEGKGGVTKNIWKTFIAIIKDI